jgi:hypothetical protein
MVKAISDPTVTSVEFNLDLRHFFKNESGTRTMSKQFGTNPRPCRYFNGPGSCRNGSSCPFPHVLNSKSKLEDAQPNEQVACWRTHGREIVPTVVATRKSGIKKRPREDLARPRHLVLPPRPSNPLSAQSDSTLSPRGGQFPLRVPDVE